MSFLLSRNVGKEQFCGDFKNVMTMELFAFHSFYYLQDQKDMLLIKTLQVQMRIVHKKW